MNRKKEKAPRPPEENSSWDGTAGVQPSPEEDEPGSAAEQGMGMEFLDNSSPAGHWMDAYMDFFRRG